MLTGKAAKGASTAFTAANQIERVVLIGAAKAPSSIKVTSAANGAARDLSFEYDAKKKVLTIRKPDVAATADFTITIKE